MDRNKLIDRVKALKSMTTGRGCTEAEAMAAAKKAADLMAEHALSEDRLEIRDQSTDVKVTLKAARSRIWSWIAFATNCASLFDAGHRRVIFVGCEPGPEIACYLRDVCDRAIDSAVAEFKLGAIYKSRRATSTRRKAVEDFTVAMVERLGRRLAEMFRETRSIDKNRAAKAVMDEMFPGSETVKEKAHKPRFFEASAHGERAADRVNLSHGVKDENRPAGLIGRG